MSKKHLTFDDRLAIQAGLQQGMSMAQIAKNIGKDMPERLRRERQRGWLTGWCPIRSLARRLSIF